MPELKHLFSPITLGKMTVKNRLVMPPMSINFGVDEDGYVTDQKTDYLAARAAGGTGMIVVGGGAIHPNGLDLPKMPPVWDDKWIPALAKMAEKVTAHGARLGMQLLHGGRQAFHQGRVAPSPLPSLGVVKGIPRELTRAEILDLVGCHGDAARRCKRAGLDFVEIHGAHGYLISEFLGPLSNIRKDDYGGSFENRTRFLLQLLRDIREKVGPDYPVGVRINGEDYIENGWHLEEMLRLAPILQDEGADWLHISAGIYGSNPVTIPSMYTEFGIFTHLAEAVKKEVSIPVIAVGRIKDPRMADRIIAEGRADMVAMGRAHLADPDLAAKAQSGRLDDIRPCIGCCLGCIDRALQQDEATCVMNPAVGREYMLGELKQVASPKRVLVVGAGPAGMAAARLAAMRGHKVTVAEEAPHTGGLLHAARLAPGRAELGDMVDFYTKELDRLGVDLRLNTECDEALVAEIKPEAVIMATGSQLDVPQILGLFDTDMELHMAVDVLEGEAQPGKDVIVIGGNSAALTTAGFLADRGARVVILNRDGHFASDISANDRSSMRESLKRPEVALYKNVTIEEFPAGGVVFRVVDQRHEISGFTDIVIAEDRRSRRLPPDMFGGVEPVVVGDAKGPRSILESQTEADEVGRTI